MTEFHYLMSSETPDGDSGKSWGMLTLNWSHAGISEGGYYDLWSPPGAPNEDDNCYRLWVPRPLRYGQFEIHFEWVGDQRRPVRIAQTPLAHLHFAPERAHYLWLRTVTTRPELDRALLELHDLAGSPETLAAFTALSVNKANRRFPF